MGGYTSDGDDDIQKEVIFPLFENKDAIIYYQDENSNVNFYYANRETKAIKKLSVCAYTKEDIQAFQALTLSFAIMENNSSRRSSNTEHQLIETMLQCKLHRDGIEYEQNGIHYRDSRTSFRLINAYRTCIRLYEEVEYKSDDEKANNYWCKTVGQAQGEEMWLLQRICEESRPFCPLPANFDNFKRGVTAYGDPEADIDGENWDMLLDGKLNHELGWNFAIEKGERDFAVCIGAGDEVMTVKELVALCWLVENAKADVIECDQEQDLQSQSSYSAQ